MNSTAIIYLIISVLSLILGIKTNDTRMTEESTANITEIIKKNDENKNVDEIRLQMQEQKKKEQQ